jgi:hypothetical protein
MVLAVIGLIGLMKNLGSLGVLLSVIMILLGIVVALLGLIIAVLTTVRDDVKQLPAAGFGISSGMGESEADLALTPWLYARVQELASLPMDPPLTFGDLRKHGIEFQVMTTNLSRSEPLVMPWSNDVYFFEPDECERLFGKKVVEAMVANPPPLPSGRAKRRERHTTLWLTKWPTPSCIGPARTSLRRQTQMCSLYMRVSPT